MDTRMKIKHRTELHKLMGVDLVGAEIGVASGLNSNDMLMDWPIKTLYLVDVWQTIKGQAGDASSPQSWHDFNLESTKRLMKRHGEKAVFMRGTSVEMARKIESDSLDFIYIDSDHSYDGVRADLYAWFHKVKTGGVIAGHDYLNRSYGVRRAVTEFARGAYDVFTVPEHKREDASFYFIKT